MKKQRNQVSRLTILWAFNEAILGGFLHAFHIPLTGLFVGGFAVIIIGLILQFSGSKRELLKSAGLVIAVKFLVSPYTPVNAYVSVIFQTIAGYFFYSIFRNFNLFAYSFAITSLLFSALQRILTYTILFGLTLWDSIDSFYQFILREFGINNSFLQNTSVSLVIIVSYLALHLFGAILVGNILVALPKAINLIDLDGLSSNPMKYENVPSQIKKKRKFFNKTSVQLILALSVILLGLTFFYPDKFTIKGNEVLIMLVRFITLISIWYFLILPILKSKLEKHTELTRRKYYDEINRILDGIENFKSLAYIAFQKSRNERFLKRVKVFVFIFIALVLFEEN